MPSVGRSVPGADAVLKVAGAVGGKSVAGIRVKIQFTSLINITKIASGDSLTLPEGTDINALLTTLGIIDQHKRMIIVSVKGQKEDLSYKLKNNDEVKLYLMLGGG